MTIRSGPCWARSAAIRRTSRCACRSKTEVPIVNSASTDPTIPETIIPWYLTTIQDDRVQGYTLARRIYTDLGLKKIALLRVNDRYGRFGVIKFKDASRRLGHPVIIEQKYLAGDTDFRRALAHHQRVGRGRNRDLGRCRAGRHDPEADARNGDEAARLRQLPRVGRRPAAQRRRGGGRPGDCVSVRPDARRPRCGSPSTNASRSASAAAAGCLRFSGLRHHEHPAAGDLPRRV